MPCIEMTLRIRYLGLTVVFAAQIFSKDKSRVFDKQEMLVSTGHQGELI